MSQVHLFCDGSLYKPKKAAKAGNQGGAFAYVGELLRDGEHRLFYGGARMDATINQLEMMAVGAAISVVYPLGMDGAVSRVICYTDSKYVANGLNHWVEGWRLNGWKTGNGEPVKNKERWEALTTIVYKAPFDHVEVRWRPRRSNRGMIYADDLAGAYRQYVETIHESRPAGFEYIPWSAGTADANAVASLLKSD